jgi:hypothetical protein
MLSAHLLRNQTDYVVTIRSSLLQGNRDLADISSKLYSRAGSAQGNPYTLPIR